MLHFLVLLQEKGVFLAKAAVDTPIGMHLHGNDWGKSLAQRLAQYKEDRFYAFVEYSGANLTHYSFTDGDRDNCQAEVGLDKITSVPNLCARAIVIADGDHHHQG
jgi:hypothetical protein